MPPDEVATADHMRYIASYFDPAIVVIEHQWTFGRERRSGLCTLMRNYGVLLGCIAAFGLRYRIVQPKKWQGEMLRLGRGHGKDTKAVSLAHARSLWPYMRTAGLHLKKHHNRADALHIARYGFVLLKEIEAQKRKKQNG